MTCLTQNNLGLELMSREMQHQNETKLAIQAGKSRKPDEVKEGAKEISYNVFDFVSREELGIKEHEEPEIDYKDDEIRVIESGFTAPPPEDNLPEGPEKIQNIFIV